MLYPPPGKTTTAAPVSFEGMGLYTSTVGLFTLPKRITGFPATSPSLAVVLSVSFSGSAFSPGASPGQSGNGPTVAAEADTARANSQTIRVCTGTNISPRCHSPVQQVS